MSPTPRSGSPAKERTALGHLGRRALALALGCVAAVLLLEGGLRITGMLLRSDRTGAGVVSGPVWLCVGDSNVYGLWVGAEESYPAALNRLLNGGAQAVNAGLPGANSHTLLATLPAQLELYEPELVLVTVGANNSWTWNTGAEYRYAEPPWYEEWKVVRLARLLLQSRGDDTAPPAPPDEFDPTPGLAAGGEAELLDRAGRRVTLLRGDRSYSELSDGEVVATLRRDLAAIAGLVRGAGAELVLVTYGSDGGIYAPANVGMRTAASELGLLLIEPEPALAAAAAERGFDAVYFHDYHPRPLGYAVVAAEIARALAGARRWPARAPQPGGLPELPVEADTAELTLAPDGSFRLDGGPPGRRFRLLVWGARAPGASSAIATREELLADPLYTASQHADVFLGRFDSRGSAAIELGEFMTGPMGAALSGQSISAGFVLLSETGSWTHMGRTHELRVP